MPLTATLTEDQVRGLAPDEGTFRKAEEIARGKRFQNLGVSADGTWLLGECPGIAPEPYRISADFHDAANPVLRSNSPSRVEPDKFGLALLLSYLHDPAAFQPREPDEDLLIRREKKIVLDEKKKTGSAAPRKITKTSPDKKLAAMREGFELLEKLLIELVATGNWFEADRLEKIERQAKSLGDSCPAATCGLRRLLVIAKQKEQTEDEKNMRAADAIGTVWAALKAARAFLARRRPDDADDIAEEVTGKALQLSELREKGCFQSDLTLFELAFERVDDESRQQRLEISNLLDMSSGGVHQAIAYRPFKGLNQIPEQTSYQTPIAVAEAAICPGFINRLVRWESSAEKRIENPPADFLAKAQALAQTDFKAVLETYRDQLKNSLAPREAVFFLRAERLGKIGDRVVVQDAGGTRLEMKDRRKDYSNVGNLVRVAGMLSKEKPAVLVRLYTQLLTNTVLGVPLAVVSPKHHVRLGI